MMTRILVSEQQKINLKEKNPAHCQKGLIMLLDLLMMKILLK